MDSIVHLLYQYKYLVLFPLAIVEGPILAVIAGFLCAGGFLNPFITYPVIVAGDIIGDTLCYMFGRWGVPVFIKKIAVRMGVTPEKIAKVKAYFDANPKKIISLSKITLGIGVAGIYLAGNIRVPYQKFILVCLVTSALQYLVYITLGILFGSAYVQISHYLNVAAACSAIVLIAALLVYFILSRRKKL